MPRIGSEEILKNAITQEQLFLVVTLYVIEIVVILIYFASNVNEGDNPLAFKIALAKCLPIALTIFFLTAFVAMKLTMIGI